MIVKNAGTAPAKNVIAKAWLPLNGRLEPLPPGITYKADDRSLAWRIGELEPQGQREISFGVLMGGVSLYQVKSGAAAESIEPKYETITTHVRGMPDLRGTVTDRRRVLDVGEETVYEIRIRNNGSSDAEKVLLKVDVTDQVGIVNTTGPVEARDLRARGPGKSPRRRLRPLRCGLGKRGRVHHPGQGAQEGTALHRHTDT